MRPTRGLSAVVFALLVAGTAACTGADKAPSFSGKAAAPSAEGLDESVSGGPAPLAEQGVDMAGGDLPTIGPKVIKTARVRLEVKQGGIVPIGLVGLLVLPFVRRLRARATG